MAGVNRRAYVIGAGPAGLAAAAMLGRAGVSTTVLERAPAVAASWRTHYDRLHLHTTRRLSALPGLKIPRSYGRWVARDDLVRYLEQYAEMHRLEVRTGVEVERIDRHDGPDRWEVHTTSGDRLAAPIVVVAAGYNHTPYLPDWPGRFAGKLSHAKDYRNAGPYSGRDVLVVGVGNTGAEIAADLADGGASRVRLAVRTPPHIVRRDVAGWPAQGTGILVHHLPSAAVDVAAGLLARVSIPDLSARGLPRPTDGLYTRVRRDGAIPVQDVGIIDAVRTGKVEPVASVVGFDGPEVHLSDGTTITPDAIIAATGYRPGLQAMVGGLGVLDARGLPIARGGTPAAPGLFFIGYLLTLRGTLRDIAMEARRVGRAAMR